MLNVGYFGRKHRRCSGAAQDCGQGGWRRSGSAGVTKVSRDGRWDKIAAVAARGLSGALLAQLHDSLRPQPKLTAPPGGEHLTMTRLTMALASGLENEVADG